ncbi:uncharacterized protein [Macrobrachium rosenbergii]|uniref:uncharacterized protein isoform X2 n=1 Tax=Macrobrachium rosenbergii TaxID=79674 RepID=UPI0034D51648
MASTPNYSTALKVSLAVLLPLILTEEVSGYVSNYGGPPPDTTDSIQSRIIPPFSPSLELARSMGSSPVTPQGNESPGDDGALGDRYNSYIGGQQRQLEQPSQQLERPNGLEDGVPRGISIPDAAYPRDLVSDKGWPKPDINPLGELGLSDEEDEEEDEEDCPPRLDEGYITWRRSNRVVRATLPHMVPSSCTPPLRCSVSTTVHRRVFLQDGDTLEVILQAPPDYTPPTPTHPPTTANPSTSPSPTPLDTATGVYSEEDFTSLPTSQPTQEEQQKQKYSPQQVGIGQQHEGLGNEQQQQVPQQPEEQYAQTGLPELQHLPESLDSTQGGIFDSADGHRQEPQDSSTQETKVKLSTLSPRQQDHKVAFVFPTTSPQLQHGEEGTKGQESVRTTAAPERLSSGTHVNSNKTHLFSRDDHHLAAAHSTNSPAATDRRKRDVGIGLPPHHILGFHPRPPAIIDDVSDVAQSRRASQHKEEEEDDDDRGSLGHERDEEKEEAQTNPIATSPLTIWKASVSEWSSCSTREGGQIGETSPEGIVTITPRFLQVGTNYFIGRSSWSSTECFQLQVTVRSSECGEGSLCSGKGICYANATMEHFQCKCCKSYMGSHCEEMNACISNPCLNNGICLDIQEGHDGDTFQCLCRFGYRGRYCEQQTNLCESYPCKNGGTCTGNHSTFTCHCPSGWSGTQCTEPVETTALATGDGNDDLAGCAGSPCNNGICVESANKEIGCFCHPGFGGQHCEFEYNECVSNPCENGGTCVDHVGKFECLCGRGYTGERCQIKYDLCTPDPCAPSRVCVDKGNSYSCECLNGLSEDDCGPHIQVCTPNPCENGGTCWIVPQARLFYCSCRPGFTGGRCQDEAVPETVGAVGTVEPGPLDVHLPLNHMRNIYVAFATLASALLIFALVVGVCHCRVNRTYRKCFVKLPRPSKVLPSVRRPRPTSLFDKSRWERSGSLRLETDPDGAAMPMTCSNSDSDAVYYNVDVCDNQELPLIK